ncbi:MAG: electron transfer flavoprotein subunit alpha/FixB family protein [Deltaproteobacteria bacterium]|nr:MAG: electron transfer flavoprotein subunit alpha/FixB family protein [Deltaproteobacteria bacterium]
MTSTGILIETENNNVKETSLGVMTAAAGQEIYALVLEQDASAMKEKLAEYGASHIVSITSSVDLSASPDLQAQALAAAVKEYEFEALLGTASAIGRDLFARVAAIIDEPLVSDCVQVNIAERKVRKSHFSGKIFATLKVNGSILLCTLRPNSIDPVAVQAAGELIDFTADLVGSGLIKIVETKKAGAGKVDLTEAPIVITGGRAIKAAENYTMLEAAAQKIGAAVGASRAAVDAGYAPHSMQVGQTGKTVSPKLYIACGVSGAVQHFAGMKTSKVIVAINEDKDAPIFAKCDYGIVGDIFDVVPVLTEKL